MACLYVSKTLEEAEEWFDYFISLGRPTFQIVKLKIIGNVFCGDAEKCFDGRLMILRRNIGRIRGLMSRQL